jgi:hypothetical protein
MQNCCAAAAALRGTASIIAWLASNERVALVAEGAAMSEDDARRLALST